MFKAQKPQATETQNDAPKAKAKAPAVVKKLSVATIWGKITPKQIPQDGELKICRIAGTAYATYSGQSTYGEWVCMVGEFAATNYETGEIFIGKSAFVPGAMGDALIGALNMAQKEDASATLKFSVDVSIKANKREPESKYDYVVRPVIESNITNEAMLLLSLES